MAAIKYELNCETKFLWETKNTENQDNDSFQAILTMMKRPEKEEGDDKYYFGQKN